MKIETPVCVNRLLPLLCALFVFGVASAEAAPVPQVTVSGNASPLLGETATLNVAMSNASVTLGETGYYPIFELRLPAGLQCNGACQSAIAYTLPPSAPVVVSACGGFPSAAGNCTNPVTNEIIARGANETILFFTLPVGTLAVGQPAVTLTVPATMTTSAAVGTPMTVNARGIFALGSSATGVRGPCGGPNDTICQSPQNSFIQTPALLNLTKTTTGNPGDATGPTFIRNFEIISNIANGASITAVTLTDPIPDSVVVLDPPAANCTGSPTFLITPAPTTCAYTHDPNGGASLTATFSNVTGTVSAQDIRVQFRGYVQRFNDNNPLAPLIPPLTGDGSSSTNTATMNYSYLGNPQTPSVASVTVNHRSLTSTKSVSVQDNAPTGTSPGDRLTWTVVSYVSDYFSFDDLQIDDFIQDGQTYVPDSFSARVVEGVFDQSLNPTRTNQGVFGGHLIVSPKDGNGNTHIEFNLTDALLDPLVYNQDGILTGADALSAGVSTRVEFSYQTIIDENYVTVPMGDTVVIDGGDVIANFANIDFRVLSTLNRETLNNVAADVTVQALQVVTKTAAFENGGVLSSPLRIGPPDDLTYRIRLVIPTGDLEELHVRDFLPTPLFNAVDSDANGVANGFTQIAQGDTAPAAGEWRYTSASTITPAVAGVVTNAGTNSLFWDFANLVENGASSQQEIIEILFTIRATSQPMADDLQLVNLLAVDHATSNGSAASTTAAAIATLRTQQPRLTIAKAPNSLVSSNGSVSGDSFINVDAGDEVTFVVFLQNTGSHDAYDVRLTDTLPAGLVAPGGGFVPVVNNGLGITNCNTLSFTETSVGNMFRVSGGIMPAGSQCNVVYRVQVANNVAWNSSIINTAFVDFASVAGGPTFQSLNDTATTTVRGATAAKVYQLGTSSDPITADPLLRANEAVTFRFSATVPEGQANSFILAELDTGTGNPSSDFLKNLAPADITFPATIQNACSNGNPALFNFTGQTDVCFTLDPSLPANQSQISATRYEVRFGTIFNLNTNNAVAETFSVDYRVRQQPNKVFGTYTNRAEASWSGGSNTGTTTFQLGDPHITLTKSSPTTPPATVGTVIRFQVTAANDGTSPAYNIGDIVDTLPPGVGSATLVSATNNGIDVTGVPGFSFSQVLNQVHVTVFDNSGNRQIVHGQQFVVVYEVTVTGTNVPDSIVGPGHPGGVIDGPGCVAGIVNSVDIFSYDSGSADPDTLLNVNAASISFALDTDGDGILNSIEIAPGCGTDSDSDGVRDYLDTDSDDNGVPDSTEYAGGADFDGDGIPNYRDLDDDGDGISDWTEIQNAGGPLGDFDGDGQPDWRDIDSDNDGILDLNEGNTDFDGDLRRNYRDHDSDNDGIPDIIEGGGADANGDGVADTITDTDGDGWSNLFDPNNGGTPLTLPNTDGVGNANYLDRDSDGDGITDLREAGGVDADGNGVVDGAFTDADSDGYSGVYDSNDGGTPLVPPNTDGTGGADYADTDSDDDTISDNVEGQSSPPGFFAPLNLDIDGDGIDNRYDTDQGGLPIVPVNTDLSGLPDYRDTDSDNDTILDSVELTGDPDGDLRPNYRDLDSDGDTLPDAVELLGNPDGDGFPNYLDTDSDGDSILDSVEGLVDSDGDFVSDYLDLDSDNDGIFDNIELNIDTDGDGRPNRLDLDSDNDGIPDTVEAGGTDANGDGRPDTTADTDGDGILNPFDVSNGGTPLTDLDFDGSVPNRLDIDSDNDGIVDIIEAGGTDANGDGRVDGVFTDGDNDGFSSLYDSNDGGTPLTRPNTDGVLGADYLDTDSDNDSISDNVEGRPNTGTLPPLGTDTDGDGLDNRYDLNNGGTPIVPINTDGQTVPDYRDPDSDNDLIPDSVELTGDPDADTIPNYRDTDSDGDGLPDLTEGTADPDGDTIPNYLDTDSDGDGIPDGSEGSTDSDGDGVPDSADLDSDNDGVPDSIEGNTDTDGDGRPNRLDRDSDNDGIPDIIESGGVDTDGDGRGDNLTDTDGDGLLNIFDPSNGGTSLGNIDTDGDTRPNRLDIDSDGDGIVDLIEGGGIDTDGNGRVDGVFIDTDNDGFSSLYDTNDGGTRLLLPNTDGLTGPDYLDTDSDNDTISDNVEGQPNPPGFFAPLGTDTDGDGLDNRYDTDQGGLPIVPVNTDLTGLPDYRDTDSDNDLIPDSVELTGDPDSDGQPNYRDVDSDGDTIPDAIEGTGNPDGDAFPNYLDTDSDGDSIPDSVEGFIDSDGDGVVNAYDPDSDNDGVLDSVEGNIDSDLDGRPNYLDLDSDNDGIPDVVESGGVDANGDGRPDSTLDSDNDGILNLFDPSNGGAPLGNVDTDGDTRPNRIDIDSDNDGIVDLVEAGGVDTDGNGRVDGTFTDTDGDGFSSIFDTNEGGAALQIPNTDGLTGPDYLDTDSDNDTITDNVEGRPNTGTLPPLGVDTDGDGLDDRYDTDQGGTPIVPINTDSVGVPDYRDLDSDNDLILDSVELTGDPDADTIPNYRDTDSDGDGVPDLIEGSGNTDGDVNPDYLDTDSDNDTILDGLEGLGDFDGDGRRNFQDVDSDNDGVLDSVEGSVDSDLDGHPNYLDLDSDNDGIPDTVESGGLDIDGDGRPDTIVDLDADGLLDLFDPTFGNSPLGNLNFDGDSHPNRIDIDSDNDGIVDLIEAGGVDVNGDGLVDTTGDADGDGYAGIYDTNDGGTPLLVPNSDGLTFADYLDVDSDGDTLLDNVEGQPDAPGYIAPDGTDTDGDGLDDAYDTDNGGLPIVPVNTDNVGFPDYRDTDSDNDNILDAVELTGDPDLDGVPNYRDPDSDGDGIPDIIEGTVDSDGDLIPDYLDDDSDNDGNPDGGEYLFDNDGDGVPNYRDRDSDNDGILDNVDGYGDADGDGLANFIDVDSDNDGIPDIVESGGVDANGDGHADFVDDANGNGLVDVFDPAFGGIPLVDIDVDGDFIGNRLDLDSDGDGIVDLIEAGGVDANGNGRVDGAFSDSDHDGLAGIYDTNDGGQALPLPNTDNNVGPDYLSVDSDGDTIWDMFEAQTDLGFIFPLGFDLDFDGLDDAYDPDQGGTPIVPVNTDGVGFPDYRDPDADNDTIPDSVELTGDVDLDGIPNYRDPDSDGDGFPDSVEGTGDPDGDNIPNYLDSDSDGDGIFDFVEGAGDFDGDGKPNYLDIDADNDGLLDVFETTADTDGDGHRNFLDLDSDNDGIPDTVEAGGIDVNGDGMVDIILDVDGDGLVDSYDLNAGGLPLPDADFDGDSVRNRLDIDSDNDGIVDLIEAGGVDANGNGRVDGAFGDSDADGLAGIYDTDDGGAALPLWDSNADLRPDYLDLDSDSDTIPDNVEGQPHGLGYILPDGNDLDLDGLDDAYDTDQGGLPIVPVNTDNVGFPDYRDIDSDNDQIPDSVELTGDPDLDTIPNYRDPDSDGDFIPDVIEGTGDIDGDTIPNYLDLDSDGDGIPDGSENFADMDGDGVVNSQDPDSDNDGVLDLVETGIDTDGDGRPNNLDLDSDNDGIPDVIEAGGVDVNGDGLPDSTTDTDQDGLLDIFDSNNGGGLLPDPDFDGDGFQNRLDLDSDNDGIVDLIEAGGVDADGDGVVDGIFATADADGDGYSGLYDTNDGGIRLLVPNSDFTAGPDYLDTDSDDDTIPDNVEGQPHDIGYIPPAGTDFDSDGLDSAYDPDEGGLPIVPVNTDNVGAADYHDTDSDNDLIPDSVELTSDDDTDTIPNYRDPDSDGDTIPDIIEGLTNTDGLGQPDYLDLDSDEDGILDAVEGLADRDADGIANFRDIDSDNDGVLDSAEQNVDFDGDGIPNFFDLDSDNDGIPDIVEAGGVDANGDGLVDNATDTDHDGLVNLFDSSNGGTLLPDGDLDGDLLRNRIDIDADGDGIVDLIEAGGVDSNGDGLVDAPFDDGDGDGYAGRYDTNDGGVTLVPPNSDGTDGADYVDTDSDGDTIPDNVEGQPHASDFRPPLGLDTDTDGLDDEYDIHNGGSPIVLVNTDSIGAFDYRDTDSDNDSILDSIELTGDPDGDTIPNYRDLDSDGDNILDQIEGNIDSDGDGFPNYLDTDSDNDGIPDDFEETGDFDGDGTPDYIDYDSDNDGILDLDETAADTDGDGVLNYHDRDSDNDGIADIVEAGGVDVNGDGVADDETDTDGDGWADLFDPTNGGTPLADGDFDGDLFRDRLDIDSDNDGLTDLYEAGGTDADSDGRVDGTFTDTDADGFSDVFDTTNGGANLPLFNTDGTDGPDYIDTDSDDDTISDNVEAQPHDIDFRPPLGTDTDSDGLDDEYDPDQGTPIEVVNTDLTGLPDYRDTDSDDDTILDSVEGTVDSDGDTIPNYRDTDSDGDTILDSVELLVDFDGDTIPNYLDLDSDNDTIADKVELAGDSDGDGHPDYNDLDSDNDGLLDSVETGVFTDNDANEDFRDADSDNDGIADIVEAGGADADGDGNTDNYVDANNDGWSDEYDAAQGGTALADGDADNDTLRNRLDLDSDNDGLPDILEALGVDADGNGVLDGAFTDTDGDGFSDIVDTDDGGASLTLPNTDGTGDADYLDTDSDDDSISDNIEGQEHGTGFILPSGFDVNLNGYDDAYDPTAGGDPIITPVNTDGTGLPDYRDTDADDDTILDSTEGTDDDDLDGDPNYRDLDSDGDGTPDSVEGTVDTDGDGTPDYLDTDSDNDGIDDDFELNGDPDGDGIPNRLDLDSDNDGIPDLTETGTDSDLDGISNFADIDSDNDGVVDILEAGGVDANGDGRVDAATDTDLDGLADIVDTDNGGTPLLVPDTDTDTYPDYLDIDSDNDGITDNVEAQTTATYIAPLAVDTDGDGLNDAYDPDNMGTPLVPVNTDGADAVDMLDTDSDNDGVIDLVEGQDANADGLADVIPLGSDTDADGLDDVFDTVVLAGLAQTWTNPVSSNVPLQDRDSDLARDWRDTDDDADTILTVDEDVNTNLNWADDDGDGDGTPDYLDLDSDNDGIGNEAECLGQVPCADTDGDGVTNHLDVDSDNDGLLDSYETTADADGDLVPNYLDIDSDNDGIVDVVEAGGIDANGDGRLDGSTDADGDGLLSVVDADEGGTALPNPNSDSDARPNFLDIDSDADGITDNTEAQTTPGYIAPSGLDSDGDGLDNAYDGTTGGTAIVPANTDGTTLPDYLDLDSDDDGIADAIEGNDVNHNGVANIIPTGTDSDSDGLDNAFDNFDLLNPPGVGFNATGSSSPLPDLDNDGIRDWRDTDDDGDGIPTLEEGTIDTDGDGIPNAYDTDSDGDGAPDVDEYGNDTDNDGIDDYIDPNCTLGFQVQLPSGERLSGVTVTNGGLYTAVTDGNGLANIPSVVNGTYNFNAIQQGGTILGQPEVTVSNGSCGSIIIVNAEQILTNPVYFVWNGFYRQQNIAGAMNKCDHTIGVEVTLFDLFGVEHATQSVPLLAHAEYDVVANALEGYGADIYGYIRVNYLEPECAEGYAAHYRFDPSGQNEEFSISKSFESVQVGPVYAEFNTMQPDPNPAKLDDESPHWVQIVNLDPTAFKNYDVILRDTSGAVVDAAEVVVGPKNRYDTQGGHVIPGKLKSGSIELIPHDPTSPYLAQVHNYNADDAFAVFANTFSFASGVTMRGGANYTQYVNISSGGGGFDWLVLSNLEDSTTAVELEFWANDGTLLLAETRMMTPRRQDHIYVSAILRGTESGIAKIRSLGGKRITAKNQLYFAGPLGNITAAYGIAARPIFAGNLTGPYNTFLGTFNYLKLHNVTNVPVIATVIVYRVDGTVIGTVDVPLAPHRGGDFELRVNLGMNVPIDSYGGIEVVPSVSGAIYSELLRIKPGGALAPIDMAQSLPVR